jgi:hypothetical protein
MKHFFLALAMICLWAACKQDAKNAAADSATTNAEQLAGHWYAMEFCQRASQYGSVLGAMNNGHLPYAYALTFNPAFPDSVTCSNGVNTWSLAVKYDQDTIELVQANKGKSIFLVYDSKSAERNITMFNSTGGRTEMDQFTKSKTSLQNGYAAFEMALNHNVIGEAYTPLNKTGVAAKVMFQPNGKVAGINGFDRYRLCTAGDCFVGGDAFDVLLLSNAQTEGSEKMFGFNMGNTNDTLTIYNLNNPNPAEKGSRSTAGIAYRLLKVKQQEAAPKPAPKQPDPATKK